MPTTLEPNGSSYPITFGQGDVAQIGKHEIRMIPVNGVPWFALPDLIDAMGLAPDAAVAVDHPDFPPEAKLFSDEEPGEDQPQELSEVAIVSPVGAWHLTHLLGHHRYAKLAAQLRKYARARCPQAKPNDPAMHLTVRADGVLPPVPSRYSGWNAEWLALRYANPKLTWIGRRSAKAA